MSVVENMNKTHNCMAPFAVNCLYLCCGNDIDNYRNFDGKPVHFGHFYFFDRCDARLLWPKDDRIGLCAKAQKTLFCLLPNFSQKNQSATKNHPTRTISFL